MYAEDIRFVNAVSVRGMTEDEHHNSIIREAFMYFVNDLRHRSSEVRQAACNAVIRRVLDTMDAEHEEKIQYLKAVIALMNKEGKADQTEAGIGPEEKDGTVGVNKSVEK